MAIITSASSNNLLKEFCKSIGMEGLELDEDGQRSLSFDEKIVVSFIGDNNDGLTAICYLGDITQDSQLRIFMEQNFIAEAHGGARFAVEPNANRMIIGCRWNAARCDVHEFSKQLEVMVNSALRAQAFLQGGGTIAAPAANETTEPALSNGNAATSSAPAAPDVAGSLAAYQNML